MARRKKTSFTKFHSTIEDIEEYYVDSEDSLNSFYDVDFNSGEISVKFFGYSKKELFDELKERKETLDRMCSLEILVAIEARIKIDYIIRGQDKLKDQFSKKIRVVYGSKENRASLKDDIISIWRSEFPEHKTRLDNFCSALDYRNWLAHGRYWQPKKAPHVHKYDYLSIYSLAEDILNNMNLIESA
ncbi:MAG: hypothetical protein HFP77_03365 [Methylococcales symbiont of Iophon sp. n. MRB-2018]|nr:MAG: hypothetical protein HFP77_03365 [Methylococcales symbiont of Iophon sp. n. MRB-2018]KAF3980310.1 MAG: hypothetical protein HFP76_02745 [Methylococcales symbiont of Iophon sp. n. MRB-2018]